MDLYLRNHLRNIRFEAGKTLRCLYTHSDLGRWKETGNPQIRAENIKSKTDSKYNSVARENMMTPAAMLHSSLSAMRENHTVVISPEKRVKIPSLLFKYYAFRILIDGFCWQFDIKQSAVLFILKLPV